MVATPPAALIQDCSETDVPITVNADLITAIKALRKDLGVCNADKAALRAWATEAQK